MLLAIARSAYAGRFIGWLFENMSFAIPVSRLRETDSLLAFHHPKPSYPVHILIVPKKAISDLSEIDETDSSFLVDLIQTVNDLVSEFELKLEGYRLVVNGGTYQEVPQLHWHLISDGDP